jgi:hypothetical protein
MTCMSPLDCVQSMLPVFAVLQDVCTEEMAKVEEAVRAIPPVDPCHNASFEAYALASFEPGGAIHAMARCAVAHMQLPQRVLSFLAYAPFRDLACGVPASTPPLPLPSVNAARAGWTLVLAALAMGGTLRSHLSRAPGLERRRARASVATAACWIALLVLSPPQLPSRVQGVLSDFYYRDDVSACLFEIERTRPNALLQDRTLSVTAPTARLSDVYRELRTAQVEGGGTLREKCGHCALGAPAGVVEHLVFETPSPPEGAPARSVIALVLPPHVPLAWRQALSQSLAARFSADPEVAFVSRQQAEADVWAAMHVEAPVFWLGVALTVLTLVASVTWMLRGELGGGVALASARVLAASVGILVVVVLSLCAGDALRRGFGVPQSAYGTLVAPLAMGTGVDGALLLINVYRRSEKLDHAWPSILGSVTTSVISFCMGLALRVPHLQYLFAACAFTLGAGAALQVLALPWLLKWCFGAALTRTCAEGAAGGRWKRLYWKPAIGALAVLWLLLLPRFQNVGTSSDLSYQVAHDSMTRRFLDLTRGIEGADVCPLYALVRDRHAANWTDVHARVARVGYPIFDWHASYRTSGDASQDAWLARTTARVAYGAFASNDSVTSVLMAGSSAVPLRTSSADSQARALEALHALDTADACFTSPDRLAAYTVDRVLSGMWIYGLVVACVSTAVGVGIAGPHGAAVFPAIVLSYATVVVALGVWQMQVHMLLVAVFIISPGVICDYTIHLSYNADAKPAVLLGALTSVASILPYAATGLPGVRDFAVCFVGFVFVGLLTAFATTVTRGWEALPSSSSSLSA